MKEVRVASPSELQVDGASLISKVIGMYLLAP